MPARLPKELYSGQSFKYAAKALGREFHVIEAQARYCCGPNYELQRLQISLPKNKLSSESLACIRQGTVVSISFAVVRKYSGRNFTGNKSSSCNYELGSIAIGAGSLFYQGPKQMLEPAMIDGEKVTTYFLLPIEFKLK